MKKDKIITRVSAMFLFSVAIFVFPLACTSGGAEHPTKTPSEQPAAKNEHPAEHPSEHDDGETEEITTDSLEKAIHDYVKADSELKGGFFLVYDTVDEEPLVLTIVKVHKDRLSQVSEGVYFFCADFKTPEGLVYDLDIFMKNDGHGLDTTEIIVHKKDGVPRYGWVEKDGIWSRE